MSFQKEAGNFEYRALITLEINGDLVWNARHSDRDIVNVGGIEGRISKAAEWMVEETLTVMNAYIDKTASALSHA